MNLTFEIDRLLDKLQECLEFSNWERKDEFYWEYKPNSIPSQNGIVHLPESWISFSPDILYFKKDDISWSEIWLKSYEFKLTENSKQDLFSIVKPFRDEDYRGNKFWINPDYPHGYWYNHTL